MKAGDTMIIGLCGGHDYVGRVVRVDVDELGAWLVCDQVVRVHDAGVWDAFVAGRLSDSVHVSSEPGEARFPGGAILLRAYPGDLAALHAHAQRGRS